MRIEYDAVKNQSNIAKHGVSFEEAARVLLDPDRLDYPDIRRDYGEKRRICLGILPAQSICGRVFVLAYTLRGNAVRVISARKANEREQNHYYLGK